MNKHSALAIVRALRSGKNRAHLHALARGSEMLAPSPFPKKRWTRKLLDSVVAELPVNLDSSQLEVAVPDRGSRIQTQGVRCTVYDGSLPDGAFRRLDGMPNRSGGTLSNFNRAATPNHRDGASSHSGFRVAISGPELLFAELAGSMHPMEHLMLGHELCGTFSRDADDPYNGPVTYHVQPVTSVEKIARFLDGAKRLRGAEAARASLAHLNDNAWSPTESLVTALLRLPIDSLGFDMGQLTLNPRMELARELPGAKGSRVPDIVIDGTPVGLNYDGLVHLDLDSIVRAAIDVGADPGSAQMAAILDKTVLDVREKAVDDIRRNRELAAGGFFIFPIVKEDLYIPGGIEQVVGQLIDMIERERARDMSWQRRILQRKELAHARHRMMLSLLPGKHERNVQVERFIQGLPLYSGPRIVKEVWIEF